MKKKYESPMAEKYEFNYVENVVASPDDDTETIIKDGKTGHAQNACGTHNSSDAYLHGCEMNPKNKKCN